MVRVARGCAPTSHYPIACTGVGDCDRTANNKRLRLYCLSEQPCSQSHLHKTRIYNGLIVPVDPSPLIISCATTIAATAVTFFIGLLAAKRMYGMRGPLRAWVDGLLTLPLVFPQPWWDSFCF